MRTNSGESEPGRITTEDVAAENVATLLERWQVGHEQDDFATLVSRIREPLARVTAQALRRSGLRDPAACEDVVAIVLDRLFRLGAGAGARPIPTFTRDRADPAAVDPGWNYVRCVARSRARDVARMVRRRARLVADYAASAAAPMDAGVDRAAAAPDVDRLRAAVASLDERSREVVELLLDGKNQAVIAHVLGVCEGTVSRIRARAIAKLRALLAD